MARTPIHPGEHLAQELKGLSISAAELARQIDVPVNRVTEIINVQRAITADTALGSRSPTFSRAKRNSYSICRFSQNSELVPNQSCGKASQAHGPQAQQSQASRVIPRNSCEGAPVTNGQRRVHRAAISRLPPRSS
jgi:hypothetical protein